MSRTAFVGIAVVVIVLAINGLCEPVSGSDTMARYGTFNDSGEFTPEDSSVERTYSIPDIDAGFMYDNTSYRLRPNFGIELDERKIFGWEIKTDAILAENGIGVSPQWKVTSIIETSVGLGVVYDTTEKSYGLMVTVMMTKF